MKCITLNTAVIGTGAAGYHAALRLWDCGVTSVALVTEHVQSGTSRNTGSDKQTYYKLSLAGDERDSVADMAKDLFAGGCVDGDNALVEAALSARCFLHLCELGVPFPTNRYGEYVGYKTDHDPHARATSAGPLTSRFMTEALERRVREIGLPIYDRQTVVRILKDGEGRVCGFISVDVSSGHNEFTLYNCRNIVLATGGPAGMYADSVYPIGHHGSTGLAFACGAKGQNLTEWQYGLASVNPRWNVSGTYMQVLPRFVSVDEDGVEREFLPDAFNSLGDCLSAVFLKGYQWPFDSRKLPDGSSVIDLLVYRESVLYGRRVYLDFMHNPGLTEELDYSSLSPEARAYLTDADACFGRPIDRLLRMNAPAVALFADKGVDLSAQRLEIAVCAQHNNGGLSVDCWWQTNVPGLFACGEVAGTHGICRPGGSALNAGQVGSLRAAQYIAAKGKGAPLPEEVFYALAAPAMKEEILFAVRVKQNKDNVESALNAARRRMSACGAAIRDAACIRGAIDETHRALAALDQIGGELIRVYEYRDTLLCQLEYLTAMLAYIESGGGSRGSALIHDENGVLRPGMDECFRMRPATRDGADRSVIQEVALTYTPDGVPAVTVTCRPVRPLPDGGGFFENVWRGFRENGNID